MKYIDLRHMMYRNVIDKNQFFPGGLWQLWNDSLAVKNQFSALFFQHNFTEMFIVTVPGIHDLTHFRTIRRFKNLQVSIEKLSMSSFFMIHIISDYYLFIYLSNICIVFKRERGGECLFFLLCQNIFFKDYIIFKKSIIRIPIELLIPLNS